MSKVTELLKKLGLEEEVITSLTAENSDADVAEVYSSLRESFGEALKNDEAFVAPIKAAVRGEVLSSKERKMMKQFGVTQEEYDALPDKTKFDSLIALCGEKAKPQGTSDEVKAEIEKLRGTLAEKDERIKKLTEEEIPQIKSQIERERQEVQRQQKFSDVFAKATEGKKLIVQDSIARTVVNTAAAQNYDLKLEEGEIVVYKKGTDLKAYDENNRPLTAQKIVESVLEENQLIRKSNAGGDGGDPPPQPHRRTVEMNGKRQPPGLAKLKEQVGLKD